MEFEADKTGALGELIFFQEQASVRDLRMASRRAEARQVEGCEDRWVAEAHLLLFSESWTNELS
jgi:hypothetical protein